jgi:hypothetical protein
VNVASADQSCPPTISVFVGVEYMGIVDTIPFFWAKEDFGTQKDPIGISIGPIFQLDLSTH